MSEKSINIEKLDNTGTINFYVGDDKSADMDKKSISIAAVDPSSLPLYGEVAITPWGKKHHKVSCRVTEQLNNQTVYQKYLVYSTIDKAREALNTMYGVLEDIKVEAEEELRHSIWLMPKMWKRLSNMSGDADIGYHDTIDDSIRRRFDNNQFDSHSRDVPTPYGYVGDDRGPTYTQGVASNISDILGIPSQYSNPGRTGVMANKNQGMVRTASKVSHCGASAALVNLFSSIHLSSSAAT